MLDRKELELAKQKYGNVTTNPLTPLNFLKRSELVFPNKKAVIYQNKTFTYRQFAERIYREANGLKKLGIEYGDRVAMLSRNNNVLLESFYGISMAGGVSVPLNFRLSASEVAYILDHSEARVLLFEHAFTGAVKEIAPRLETVKHFIEIDSADKKDGDYFGIKYEEFLSNSSPDPLDVPVQDENDMLSICYTSGTTGMPKGCVHTHRGTYLNALGEALESHLSSNSAYLWTLPMFHCQGWCFAWAVTAVGAKHVCIDAVRAEPVYNLMIQEKITNLCAAPTVYTTIADYMKQNNYKFDKRVFGYIAGAPPSPMVIGLAENVGFDVHQVYGLTEVYGPHTICEWHSEEWDDLPLADRAKLKSRQGVPYATCTFVRVVDDDMNDIPWDGETRGEIVMRGNNVMQWYFKEHDKTEEAFRGGWFHSGDAAVIHPDGYIEIVDRIKDIIITGGENVSSVEVENVIIEHPAVSDVAIIGKPDEKWGEIVKAVIQLAPGESVTKEEIQQFCRERLAGFKIPREVEFNKIPRTATGKIQKNVLKQRERELVKKS